MELELQIPQEAPRILVQGTRLRDGHALEEPTQEVKNAVLYGKDYEVTVKFRNRWGRERSYTTGFEGAVNYIERKREETESAAVSEKLDSYMREIPCPTCHGARLKPEVLAVHIGDKSIAELSDMSISEAREFLATVDSSSVRALSRHPSSPRSRHAWPSSLTWA